MPGEYLPPVVAVLQGDTSDFDEKIDDAKEQIESFNDEEATATLDVDDEDALATLDELKAEADEWGDKVEDAHIGLSEEDYARADSELTDLIAQADDWGTKVEDAHIGISQEEYARTVAELEVLSVAYDELAASADDAAVAQRVAGAASGGGGGYGALLGALGGLSGISPMLSALKSAGSVIVGFLSYLVALVGAIEGVSVAMGGLVTMFSAAAVGTLAFAAIAIPAIESVMTAISAGTQLTGPLGELEDAIKGLKTEWTALEQTAGSGVIDALVWALQQLDQILPELTPLFTEAAQGFEAFFAPIFQGMESGGFQTFMDWMGTNATPIASAFGDAVTNIATAWAGWMEAFGPALPGLEKGLKTVTGDWATFADGLSKSPAWSGFLTNGEQDLSQLGILAKNLGNAIGQIFTSVGPSGPTALKGLNHALEAIGKLVTPLIGPLATLGAGLMTDLGDFLTGLSGGGKDATKNLGKLLTDLGRDAKEDGPYFYQLGRAIGALVGPIGQVLGPLSDLLTVLDPKAPRADQGNALVGWMNSAMGQILTNIARTIYQVEQNFANLWGNISSGVAGVAKWFATLPGDVMSYLASLPGDFAKLWSTVTSGASKIPGDIASWFESLPGDIGSWLSTLPGDFSKIWATIVKDAEAIPGEIAKWFSSLPGDIAKDAGGVWNLVVSHIPGMATGGYLSAGMAAVIGEEGPELWAPGVSGTVYPNSALGGLLGSVSVTNTVVLQGGYTNGQTAAIVEAAMQRQSQELIQRLQTGQ